MDFDAHLVCVLPSIALTTKLKIGMQPLFSRHLRLNDDSLTVVKKDGKAIGNLKANKKFVAKRSNKSREWSKPIKFYRATVDRGKNATVISDGLP